MKRSQLNSRLLLAFAICLSLPATAQRRGGHVDLASLLEKGRIKTYNRNATASSMDADHKGVHLDGNEGPGVAWLNEFSFTKGEISFDIKGKNVMQRSFVGIAFAGVNDTTYEAVYFRPFNFRLTDPVRKRHSVQYISVPGYDWPLLRDSFPDQYEQEISPEPDPDQWFHVRIEIGAKTVNVYVNDNKEASLSIERLTPREGSKVGLWVGNGSEGDWANLAYAREEEE